MRCTAVKHCEDHGFQWTCGGLPPQFTSVCLLEVGKHIRELWSFPPVTVNMDKLLHLLLQLFDLWSHLRKGLFPSLSYSQRIARKNNFVEFFSQLATESMKTTAGIKKLVFYSPKQYFGNLKQNSWFEKWWKGFHDIFHKLTLLSDSSSTVQENRFLALTQN